MNLNEKLSILLEKAEIRLNSEQIDLLVRFVNLISKWNKVYNLTSIKNFD
jgi:16S rRNA (guanine527-N7)-methyltransferase